MENLKIILACSAGMSTSMLVEKMKAEAASKSIDTDIIALSSTEVEEYVEGNDIDVLLLGPQVKYLENRLKEQYEDKDFPIATVDSRDYGMMNGEKVLEQAINLVENK